MPERARITVVVPLSHMDDTRGADLRIVTFSQLDPDTVIDYETVSDPCAGTYTCDCVSCVREVAKRARQGVRSIEPSSPFRLRPAA